MTRACGTYAKYKIDGCRCYPCAAEVSAYNERRNRSIAYGTWNPFMDAAPVREHVRRLSDCGIGTRRLVVLAGVSRSQLRSLLTGKPGKEPSRKVRTENALRILAVEPTLENIAPSTPIDSAGSIRRLQGLVAVGWSQAKLAARLEMTDTNFSALLRYRQVTAAKALRIRALYDELWSMAPPESTHREKIAASRARNHAKASGWLPPMAWDEDLIDLPESELTAEIARRVAQMDDAELARCRDARYRLGDRSPLITAAAREHQRREKARYRKAAA